MLRTALLTLLVVMPADRPDGFVLAGPVDDRLLRQAARDLLAHPSAGAS